MVHGYHCQTFFHFRGRTSVPHGGKMYRNEFPAFLLPLSVPREHPVSVPCRPRSNRKDHSGTSEIHHDVPLPETHNRLLPPETVPSTLPGKMFSPKHRNKILIPEVLLQSISFSVMLICRHSFFVHVARIPLIGICRNTVNTPVYKNTEFFFRQPLRHLRFTQRCP